MPDGSEAIGTIQGLGRSITSPGGQVIESDRYLSLPGSGYSATGLYLGTPNVNFFPTTHGYDHRGSPSTGTLGKGTNTSGLERRVYFQQDADHNVTGLSDASGSVVERYAYDPYGSVSVLNADWTVKGDGTVGSSGYASLYLHQGLRYDPIVGTYDSRMRVYDPQTGRFEQQDPAGSIDGPNLYQFTTSNPQTLSDPSGLTPEPDWGAWVPDYDDGIGFNAEGLRSKANEAWNRACYHYNVIHGNFGYRQDGSDGQKQSFEYWSGVFRHYENRIAKIPPPPPPSMRGHETIQADNRSMAQKQSDEISATIAADAAAGNPMSQALMVGHYGSIYDRLSFISNNSVMPVVVGLVATQPDVRSAKRTFVDLMEPVEAARNKAYWASEATDELATRQRLQVSPFWGGQMITDLKISSETGVVYIREAIYDEFGRLVGTNDWYNHGRPEAHPVPHYHVYKPAENSTIRPQVRPGLHPDTPDSE